MAVLPMFPLGSVLVPGMALPLHVFEERYRQLVADCLAGEGEFGVVLIERGSEVGGGDVRSMVGTVARIIEAVTFPDGRWAIGAVGDRRVKIEGWLPDEPYPRAEVTDWPDVGGAEVSSDRMGAVLTRLRRSLAVHAELGDAVADATFELSDDPALACFQIVAVAPVGTSDQQRLLTVPTAASRLDLLEAMLLEDDEVLEARLRLDLGDQPPGTTG